MGSPAQHSTLLLVATVLRSPLTLRRVVNHFPSSTVGFDCDCHLSILSQRAPIALQEHPQDGRGHTATHLQWRPCCTRRSSSCASRGKIIDKPLSVQDTLRYSSLKLARHPPRILPQVPARPVRRCSQQSSQLRLRRSTGRTRNFGEESKTATLQSDRWDATKIFIEAFAHTF